MTAQSIYKSPRESYSFLAQIHSKVQRNQITLYTSRQIASHLLEDITEEMLAAGKVADIMVVATLDRQHYGHAMPALELGYHLLLEKPVAPTAEECAAIEKKAKECGVKIMVCQIFSGNTATSILSTVRAIKYAADNGAVVLQCSWGYISPAANEFDWGESYFNNKEEWIAGSPLEREAIEYFTHYAGSANGAIEGGIAVFAGGNESAPAAGFPGAADEYISVAATAADFTPAVYTNYGPGTTISAPGGDQDYYFEYVDDKHNYGEVGCILSTLPYHVAESGYGYMEGTSMACPHVSCVVALGISYATQLRRHFKASELQKLLIDTAVPIDSYMTGKKDYCRYVADIGPIQPMQMSLSNFRGQMGAGQINAAAFLAAIASDAGVEMVFPNIYVAKGSKSAVVPSRYFVGGESLTYTVTIADTAVATCATEGNKLIFSGVESGSTKATITASNGKSFEFSITVRRDANNNGWL